MTEMTVRAQKAAGGMLALTASAHFLNDMIQSVIPASIRCQSGEYTLSENYVHGLAAFGTRLKNFESPHSSRGSSPGLPAGNSVNPVNNGRWQRQIFEVRLCLRSWVV